MPATPPSEPTADFDAIIVGAGFSGLYMLYRLRDVLGLSARVYEAADGVGGTWQHTRRAAIPQKSGLSARGTSASFPE